MPSWSKTYLYGALENSEHLVNDDKINEFEDAVIKLVNSIKSHLNGEEEKNKLDTIKKNFVRACYNKDNDNKKEKP